MFQPKDEARIRELIEEGTDQFNDVEEEIDELRRELQSLKRVVDILLVRNGGLSETERIAVEA